jgi:hypothetical protein
MLLSVVVLKKILDLLNVPRTFQNSFVYLYLSSALMISVVFIIAQYDLFSVVFQLLGVYALMKNNRRGFVLWFGLALCFKYFALIIFVPLLLLREKRVMAWLKNFVLVMIPLLITRLPFLFSVNAGGGDSMVLEFAQNMLSYSTSYLNVFVVVYICLLAWCYLRKRDEQEELIRCIPWVCFVTYAAFFGLLNVYPYWGIMLAPFVILIFANAPNRIAASLLLEGVGLSALVFGYMEKYNWCYFGNTMKPMLLSCIMGKVDYGESLIYHIMEKLIAHPVVFSIMNSIFVASMAAMAFITYPRQKKDAEMVEWQPQSEYNDILILRCAVISILCLLPVLSVFI